MVAVPSTGRPRRPRSSARRIRWQGGKKRRCETTPIVAPPACAAATIASQSARQEAIGFSTRTWTPARAAAIVGATWPGWGVQTQTACTRARRSISSMSEKAPTPYMPAKARRRSEGLLQTATNSDSGRFRSAAACRWATLPAPTTAVLSLCMGKLRSSRHASASGPEEHLHQALLPGAQAAEPFRALLERGRRADEPGHVDPAARDQPEAGGVFAGGRARADERYLPRNDGLQREVDPRLGVADERHRAALAHECHRGSDRRRQARGVERGVDPAAAAEAPDLAGQVRRIGPRHRSGAES